MKNWKRKEKKKDKKEGNRKRKGKGKRRETKGKRKEKGRLEMMNGCLVGGEREEKSFVFAFINKVCNYFGMYQRAEDIKKRITRDRPRKAPQRIIQQLHKEAKIQSLRAMKIYSRSEKCCALKKSRVGRME